MIDNPDYKGEWKAKQIDNPDYKGAWIHPMIDNPDYTPDDTLYQRDEICSVGLDLWQVKAGTIFDNFLVTDDIDEAKKIGDETWGAIKDGEKKMKDEQDEEERKKAEEEAQASADDEDKDDDEVEDSEDDDDLDLDLGGDLEDPEHDEL